MNIEVRGIGFGNKGAELMLRAILDRLKQTFPETCFVADPVLAPYEQRARYGLYQKLDARRSGRRGVLVEAILHKGYRQRYGLVGVNEVDAVLDASGFAYGDAWAAEWIRDSAKECERMHARGKKVILLPQAFGPFTDTAVREATTRLFAAADLIFARDPESLGYAKELVPDVSVLKQAPDFTCLVEGRRSVECTLDPKRVGIVPNRKMVTHGPVERKEAYLPFLADCMQYVRERGYHPCIVLHEGRADRELAGQLRRLLPEVPEIIDDEDPIVLKGALGTCAFVIGSRFHGLVSTLSQGIPAIGTAWSHKYQHLFEDYKSADFLVDPLAEKDAIHHTLDRLCDETSRQAQTKILHAVSLEVKDQSKAMWGAVETLLQS